MEETKEFGAIGFSWKLITWFVIITPVYVAYLAKHNLHLQGFSSFLNIHFTGWVLPREVYFLIEASGVAIGTLSNRRRRPDDGNRKRDISFETSLRMYKTLWPDVAHSRPQRPRSFWSAPRIATSGFTAVKWVRMLKPRARAWEWIAPFP